MSLIDEALKRARMEAAQTAAQGEGLPYPTIPRHLAPRRRAGWLVPLVVALAVIAGVAVGLLLASRGGLAREEVAEQTLAARSPGAGPVSPASPLQEPTALTPAPSTPAPSSGGPATGGAGMAARTEPHQIDREQVSPATSTLPPTASTVEPAPAPAPERAPRNGEPPAAPPPASAPPVAAGSTTPTATAATDPDSGVLLVLPERPGPAVTDRRDDPPPDAAAELHAQQVPLPGGGAIELGGIAWSETGPFALINGRVVGPGSVIEGYTVERIRPGHVVLTGDGRRVQLSLQ